MATRRNGTNQGKPVQYATGNPTKPCKVSAGRFGSRILDRLYERVKRRGDGRRSGSQYGRAQCYRRYGNADRLLHIRYDLQRMVGIVSRILQVCYCAIDVDHVGGPTAEIRICSRGRRAPAAMRAAALIPPELLSPRDSLALMKQIRRELDD